MPLTLTPFTGKRVKEDQYYRILKTDHQLDIFTFTFSTLQIRVLASDGGTPPLQATTTVQVIINRNFQAPRWDQPSTRITVDETLTIGSDIVQLTAIDQDRQVKHNVIILPGKLVYIFLYCQVNYLLGESTLWHFSPLSPLLLNEICLN